MNILTPNYQQGDILTAEAVNGIITEINTIKTIITDKDIVKSEPNFTIKWPNQRNYEVGTNVDLAYEITFTDGKYKYPIPDGQLMGCTFKNCEVQFNGENSTSSNHTFSTITVQEDTRIEAIARATHSDASTIPLTNLGNKYEEGIYKERTIELPSFILNGYREGCFYGTIANSNINSDNITQSDIRNLSKSGNSYISGKTLSIEVKAGDTSIIIACPDDFKGPSYALNTTVNAPMIELYGENNYKKTLAIPDAGGNTDKNYHIWIFTPNTPYTQPATIQITLY